MKTCGLTCIDTVEHGLQHYNIILYIASFAYDCIRVSLTAKSFLTGDIIRCTLLC